MFRYQDDCLVLNDCKQFIRYYPSVMVLENTNATGRYVTISTYVSL